MDFGAFLVALTLLAAGHTAGHISTANRTGAGPASVDLQTMSENWNPVKGESPLFESDRQAAGFKTQDILNKAIDTPESNAANAFYKTFYIATNGGLGKRDDPGGDIGGIEKNSGNKYAKEMVAATALFDAVKSQYPGLFGNNDLSLTTIGSDPEFMTNRGIKPQAGSPGLLFTHRW